MQVQNMGNHYAYGLQRDRTSNANSASDTGNGRGRQAEAANPPAVLAAPLKTTAQQTENTAVAMPAVQNRGGGVVQKLQEGHFQGVASVRLSINFQQQILLSNSQQAGEALQAGSKDLLGGLDERMTALGEEFGGFGEGVEGFDFNQEVSNLMFSFTSTVEGFFAVSNESSFDPNGVLEAIHSAFQDFFSSVSQLGMAPAAMSEPSMDDPAGEEQVTDGAIAAADDLGAADDFTAMDDLAAADLAVEEGALVTDAALPADETLVQSSESAESQELAPGEETVAAAGEIAGDEAAIAVADEVSGEEGIIPQEPGAENTQLATSYGDAMQELQSWFDSQWGSLRSTIDEMMAMPALSEPRGNGVAYSRFLAVYSELNGEAASGAGSTGASGSIATEA